MRCDATRCDKHGPGTDRRYLRQLSEEDIGKWRVSKQWKDLAQVKMRGGRREGSRSRHQVGYLKRRERESGTGGRKAWQQEVTGLGSAGGNVTVLITPIHPIFLHAPKRAL